MQLVPVNIDSLRIGQMLPFSLHDAGGVLLAQKGQWLNSRNELDRIVAGRGQLFMNLNEDNSNRRAYLGKLHQLVTTEQPLGQIANTSISSSDLERPHERAFNNEADWPEFQLRTSAVLRETDRLVFGQGLDRLQADLSAHCRRNPDGTLFALIYLASSEIKLYSATHAMLVAVICNLAAHEVLKWPADLQRTLGRVALTMNLGMTELQDRLAQQKERPSPEQRRQIDNHAKRSAQQLERLGVSDPTWLEAVRTHHVKTAGPLAERTDSQRLARLIQRADEFAARLSPRVVRAPELPAVAMQACYYDEQGKVDEAGTALIKAVGIYSPGSFVRLASNEVAVVIQRGANTTMPRVAVVLNRSGLPMSELTLRDTSLLEFRITASVAHRNVRVKINLPKLLALTRLRA